MTRRILAEDLRQLPSSGSGRGISYYTTITQCPRKARLDDLLRKAGQDAGGSPDARVGTLFHKFMEVYYSGDTLVLPQDYIADEEFNEALRLYAGWAQRFSPEFWGTVEAVEPLLPAQFGLGISNETVLAEREKFATVFGDLDFTMRLDLVIRITADSLGRVRKVPGLETIQEGTYIMDYKTRSKTPSHGVLGFAISPQFIAYQMGWEALRREKVSGMIAACVVRHKKLTDESFKFYLIPEVSKTQRRSLWQFLDYACGLLDKPDQPNISACNSGYRICQHLLSGTCKQTEEE
jgi:hypothetical protein